MLDIETTGLDRSKNEFVLGGLYDVEQRKLHQVFAQSVEEEREALKAFGELMKSLDVVITYNGAGFDMPFLTERASKYDDVDMPMPYDLDLYRVVRGHSPLKRLLPNLRQKTVEAYMGLWQSRTDEIDGAESVRLYREYERTGDPAGEKKILLHNSDDVRQLTRLIKVIEKCDFHEAMYSLGFPVRTENGLLVVENIRLESTSLTFGGSQQGEIGDFRCYEMDGFDVEAVFDKSRCCFSIRMPLMSVEGLAVIDIRSAGLDEDDFSAYPECGSGFLVIRGEDEIRHRECNHLIRAYLKKLTELTDSRADSFC